MSFSTKEIEIFYLETMGGFYLNECKKNDPGYAKSFYENQFNEFKEGFELCQNKLLSKQETNEPKETDMFIEVMGFFGFEVSAVVGFELKDWDECSMDKKAFYLAAQRYYKAKHRT